MPLIADALSGLQNPNTRWMLAGVVMLTAIYLMMRTSKHHRDPLSSIPSISPAQQRAVEREMANLLVDLQQMARQVTAQLDTRAARLEQLIEDADRRIAALNGEAGPQPPSSAGMPGETMRIPLPADTTATATPTRYQSIYDLADQGRSAAQIAHELERPVGEIELILALRRRGGQSTDAGPRGNGGAES